MVLLQNFTPPARKTPGPLSGPSYCRGLRNNTPFTVHYLDTDILIAVHVHTKISVKFPVKKITSSILGPIGLWDCGVGSYAPVEKMSVL